MQRESGVAKRKKERGSSSPNTSDIADFKKPRHQDNSSDSESEEQINFEDCSEIIETDEELDKLSDGKPKYTLKMDEGQLVDKISTMLNERLEKMKVEIVQEVKQTMQTHIERLEAKVFSLEQINDNMRKQLSDIKTVVESQNDALKVNEKKCDDLMTRVVELEQYSRRENLKIFGLAESRGEDIKKEVVEFLTNTMKCDIDETDISAVHRLDTKSHASIINGARPVIVRFTNRETKISVMRSRKILKGSKVFISDHLCKSMNALFNRVRKHTQVENAWSWDGSVFFKDTSGKVYKIRYGQTVEDVMAG